MTTEHLKEHFTNLIQTHSWSTVKVDRNGLQFFYKHVISKDWKWVDLVKPPQVKSLPDVLTADEISLIINSTREARYQTYILTVYSMGLRLGEALTLKVGDIDAKRMRVHVRNGKIGISLILNGTGLLLVTFNYHYRRHNGSVLSGQQR